MVGSNFGSIAAAANVELEKRARARLWAEDPVAWAEEYLGLHVWKKQRDILYAIRDNRNTAVAAGHGVGKTFIVAVAAAWWIDIHPIDKVFVASTAPSADQVNLLWDNIRNIHSLASQRYKEGLVDHDLPGYVTGDNKWKLDNGVIIGQGRKPPDQKSDVAFQGRHADYLLAIGDEAVGLSSGFLEALGHIATGQYNRRIIIANPTDPTSAMAKIWKDKNKSWVTIHISVMDSPRITPEEGWNDDWAPGLSGWEFVENALNDYGSEDDPRYIARVLGEWAFDAGNNLFTAQELARAKNTHVRPDPNPVREFGVDIARMGPDHSIIYMMEEGEVWETDPDTGLPSKATGKRGLRIRLLDKWSKAPLSGGTPDNPGSAERIHSHALAEGVRAVKIDASGMGTGVVDGLYPLNWRDSYTVIEVFGGATPTDKRAYVNARAEEYFSLKKRFHAGLIDLDPADETLFDELLGIVYEYADKGQIKMESKDSMKKRGAKSPDHADALWYAAMSSYSFLDSPFAGLESGDRVYVDPHDLGIDFDIDAIGMPI